MWYIVLAILFIVYYLQQYVTPFYGWLGTFVIQPIIYIALGIITYLIASNQGKNILSFKRIRRWYFGNSPTQAALLIGAFHVAMLVILGLFVGFGKNPNSFKPTAILLNIFFVSTFVFGIELTRSYFINTLNFPKKKLTLYLLLITLLYIFIIEIGPGDLSFLTFSNPPETLEFIGSTIITALAINLLATYLCRLGGATASIGYMGMLMAFEWFSPVLPKPHWTMLALINTIAPAIGFIIIEDSLKTPRERRKQKRQEESGGASWTAVAIIGLFIVFFSFGFLGFTPTVIYSGSMSPSYEVGDIVLIDKDFDPTTIEIGDIVQYVAYDNHTLIIHRIINTTTVIDETQYITKGDANDDPDFKPIPIGRIQGTPVYTIPKLGWIQIAIKTVFRTFSIPL